MQRQSAVHKLNQYNNPRIKKELPHLKNVFKRNSNGRSELLIYHYDDAWNPEYIDHTAIRYSGFSDLDNVIFSNETDCRRRVILIEDICKELVDDLIGLLDISPEFFENHLVGARLPNEEIPDENVSESKTWARGRYLGIEATSWTTRRLKRDFRSVKWYRPYTLRLGRVVVDISERSVRARVHGANEWKFDCNIWRRHTNFQADGATWSFEEGESTGLSGDASIAYEERLTVWQGERRGYELIIVLTDTGICDALYDGERSQVTSRRMQMYQIRKAGKEYVTTSKRLESTRPTRSDRGDSRDDDLREKDISDGATRDTRPTGGVLSIDRPSGNYHSHDWHTDFKPAKFKDRTLVEEKDRERSVSRSPDVRIEERYTGRSGPRPTRDSIRYAEAMDGANSEKSERKSHLFSSSTASRNRNLHITGQDTRNDNRPHPTNELATAITPAPVIFAENKEVTEDTLQTNNAKMLYAQSDSLEELLRLDTGMKSEDLEDCDPNSTEHPDQTTLIPPPSPPIPIQDLDRLDIRPLKSDEYLLIASQAPLPQSKRTRERRRASSDRERARSRSHVRSIRSRPSISPRRTRVSRPVMSVRNKIVRNVASRCPIHDSTLEEARDRHFLRTLTSTREDIEEWFGHSLPQPNDEHSSFGPVALVYNIIHNDTVDLLLLIDDYLDTITAAADDEIILERNIVAWRRMLWFFGKELRSLSNNLSPFAMFLLESDQVGGMVDSAFIPKHLLQDLAENILGVQKRLEITFGTLVSSISVVEARKGIAETESVNRLTELAFVYIPLSFAASFFGMQVKELNPSTTSISAFFGLGIGVTLLSYSVRLVIRSNLMVNVRHGFLDQVRTDSSTPENVPIRTRDAARFMIRRITRPLQQSFDRFGYPAMYVILGSSPIVPMIVVWSRAGLAGSMKLAISIVFILVIVLLGMGWVAQYLQGRVTSYYVRRRQEASAPDNVADGTDDEEDEE